MRRPEIERMGRWASPEPCRDTGEALTALALEARRRGITYGQLVGITSGYERRKIIRAYQRVNGRRRNG